MLRSNPKAHKTGEGEKKSVRKPVKLLIERDILEFRKIYTLQKL